MDWCVLPEQELMSILSHQKPIPAEELCSKLRVPSETLKVRQGHKRLIHTLSAALCPC